ncbi:hypothetical protein N1031_17240 [Herbiconiux moechotypicola]|uniref:sialidase family protein n=1 Tax=Herbiconiux moechotypicola TaxID=637393 RepID=UPI00217E5AF1|nr:hypothetical protein [Herbiconiux moechotypicola]MCS5731509.1 hypothetical protein [Herbiconiux moechotypicola]
MAAVAIAVFVAVDVALVFVATSSGSLPVSTVVPISPSAASDDASTPIDAVDAAAIAPSSRLLTAWDASSAWRLDVGSCPESDVVVEHSVDGGRTWDGYDLGANGGLSSATALQAIDDARSVILIAFATADCAPSWVESSTAGSSWASYPGRTSTAWFITPSNRAVVQTPTGPLPAPCAAVVGLASIDAGKAAALCSDGQVHRTDDGGVSWTLSPTIAGAAAIGSTVDGYLVASTETRAACQGISIFELGSSRDGTPEPVTDCLASDTTGDDIALSGNISAIWVWAGTSVLRSRDGGSTWQ